MLRRLVVAVTCWGLFAFASMASSHAANVFLPGNGSRSMGKADAVIASGDDADAVFHNPANLARMRGFGIRLDGYLSFQRATFKRIDVKENGDLDEGFDPVSKDTTPVFIPMLVAWYNHRHTIGKSMGGSLSVALFGFGPHGRNGYKYPEKAGECQQPANPETDGSAFICDPMPEPGPQRLNLIFTSSPMIYMGLAAAYQLKFSKDFAISFGGTFKAAYLYANQKLSIIAASTPLVYIDTKKSINNGEVLMELTADGFYFTGDLGINVKLPFGFRIGASFLLPAKTSSTGELKIQVNKKLTDLAKTLGQELKIFGKDIRLEVPFAGMLRTGVSWTGALAKGHGLTVEVAFVMELWGEAQQSLDVYPENIKIVVGNNENVLGKVEIPQPLSNSYSVRVGAEYNWKETVYARIGYLWEGGSTSRDRISASTIDYPDKMAVSVGFSYNIKAIGLMIDLSAMHFFDGNFQVRDSKVIPADVSPDDPLLKRKGTVASTSNGDYKFGVTIVSLGLRGNWGR